jgi:hypothetical protein
MAKRAKPSKKDDGVKAVVVAALKRAIAAVEGSMADKSTKPREGCYPVDLTVGINGDITVGKDAAPGEDREVPVFGAGEVLAGLLALKRSKAAQRKVVLDGVNAADALEAEGSLAAGVKDAAEMIASACHDTGCTKAVPTPGRAGAVSGKPTVLVRGTQDLGIVQVEVGAA